MNAILMKAEVAGKLRWVLLKFIVCLVVLGLFSLAARAQTATLKYTIEVAGLKIGTMTEMRTVTPQNTVYEQVSDVAFWFFGKIKIYYKVVSQHDALHQLIRSDVNATTNRGNYRSDIVWNNDHYDINVKQYKYSRQATEPQRIDFTICRMYFEEPTGRDRVFAEYFGNYASITPTGKGSYRVRIDDREDEYFYEKGKLVKIVKKNSVKNYVLRAVVGS